MDIANITALTRSGSYPAPRAAVTSGTPRAMTGVTRAATPVVPGQPPPVEQVLQGELLQKRRKTAAYDSVDLLDTMRAMDRVLRDTATASTDTTAPRDARRAIATYTQQTIIPNTLTGATAAATIDYFV